MSGNKRARRVRYTRHNIIIHRVLNNISLSVYTVCIVLRPVMYLYTIFMERTVGVYWIYYQKVIEKILIVFGVG